MSQYKNIQWYPGHMFKTVKELTKELKLVDVVLMLLDARAPLSSMNPMLLTHIQSKPMIYVLNKKDLADQTYTSAFLSHIKHEHSETIALNSLEAKTPKKIIQAIDQLMYDDFVKRTQKGLKKKVYKVLVLGIPNVGKSTLINTLSKKKVVKTGNTPGVTKQLQWTRVSQHIDLLDSPGVLWPKFDDEQVAMHLALTGAIKDRILPLSEVVEYGLNFMKAHYPDRLIERYQIDIESPLIEAIGKKRGALQSGGIVDEERVYQIFLNDLRTGKLGGITFDRISYV
ncbi:MAG: ribosome biogenesis GTPase YlqF [Acholeplasmataceae bacterium]